MKNFFLTGVSGLLGLNFFLNLKNNYRIYSLIHKKKIPGIKNIKLKLQHSNKIKKFLLKKKLIILFIQLQSQTLRIVRNIKKSK